MNKSYRIVWSAARQAWIVASERAGCGGRPPLAVKKALGAMLLLAGLTAMSAEAANYIGTQVSGPAAIQTLENGDTSHNVSLSNNANQYVNSGAVAIGTNVTSGANQTVNAGGFAPITTLNGDGSFQYIKSGGMASNTMVDNQATQYVYSGGSIDSTTLYNGGHLTLDPNASAYGIFIETGGRASINGATANTVIVNTGGFLSANVGAQINDIQQLAGGSLSGDTSTTLSGINSLGSFYVSGGLAQNLLLENGGIFSVLSGHTAYNTVVGATGYANITSGGTANGTTVLSGGKQGIGAGGFASGTNVFDGGTQIVNSGGTAIASQINGGLEEVEGYAIGAMVNQNGQQTVLVGGEAENTLVNSGGVQSVYGSATSAMVNSGATQYVQSGGSAVATTVAGGVQFVSAGGSATNSIVNSGGQLNSYGSVTSATINSNGMLFALSGASTDSTNITAGGEELIDADALSTAATVQSGGYQTIYAGGAAVSASVVGGTQRVFGSAIGTTLTSGGVQYVSAGGTAHGTLINGDTAQGVGGTANSATVAAGGAQYVYSGGSANWTTVTNNGVMNVQSGGATSGGTIKSGGMLYADQGSTSNDLVMESGAMLRTFTSANLRGTNALGAFSISAGMAKNLLLENNGYLNVQSGGSAKGTVVQQGGWEDVYGSAIGTTVNSGGVQSVRAGGTAKNTVVNSNGELYIFNGGLASHATINQGGLLTVNSGGTATDTTVTAGGLLNIADGGVLTLANSQFVNDGTTTYDTSTSALLNTHITGSGQLTKNGVGTLTLSGQLSQAQINLNSGSVVMDGLQANTNIIALSGTALSLVNNTTLTGIIDPTDVNIDQSSTWNITGDSLVDDLTNAGSIVFAAPVGAFTPHTLTVTNLAGNGGTITLNTIAGDSSSPIDKVIIDGGQATGSTGLRVLNRGGLGALTTGNGIAVIQAMNGATTGANAFSLNQPLVAGAYSYSLYRNADESWYLTSQQTQPTQPTQPTVPGDDNTPAPVNYRDGMWSYAALPSLSLDYDRLLAGSADTRFHYAADSRMWGRIEAGHLRHADSGSLTGGSVPESSSAYSFVQLGGDLWQLDGANADWKAGVYGGIGLMRSDVWRDGGKNAAGTDRDTVYTGGAYLSGHSHSGLRVDGLLQASRHSLSVASNDNTRLSTDGIGWLASAEIGQAFNVTNSLSLEPQLQYSIQGLNLDDGQDDAANISWSDSRRQSVRAGLKLSTPQHAKQKVSWWLTPSVTQTYGGHSGVTASVAGVSGSEASIRSNFSGTGVGINGGIDAQIRQNVTLGVQSGWSEALHGSESGGYYGMVRLGVSFR